MRSPPCRLGESRPWMTWEYVTPLGPGGKLGPGSLSSNGSELRRGQGAPKKTPVDNGQGERLLPVEERRRATRGEGAPFLLASQKGRGDDLGEIFTSGTLLNKICTWLPLHLRLAFLPYCCGATLTRDSSALEREQRRAYGGNSSLNALLDVAHVELSFWSWGLLHERKKPRSCAYYACQRTVRLLRHLQNKKSTLHEILSISFFIQLHRCLMRIARHA